MICKGISIPFSKTEIQDLIIWVIPFGRSGRRLPAMLRLFNRANHSQQCIQLPRSQNINTNLTDYDEVKHQILLIISNKVNLFSICICGPRSLILTPTGFQRAPLDPTFSLCLPPQEVRRHVSPSSLIPQ